jgi:hypothetical protein
VFEIIVLKELFPVNPFFRSKRLLSVMIVAVVTLPLVAQEPVDRAMITRLRQEEFRNGQVMQILEQLSDDIGPRLTGSPNFARANQWALQKFNSWGLADAHLEAAPWGRGWQQEYVNLRMTAPDIVQLYALPMAWTPGTAGVVRGAVVRFEPKTSADLAQAKGTLAGKIVLLGEVRELKPPTEPEFVRYDDQKLEQIAAYDIRPGMDAARRDRFRREFKFRQELRDFLIAEKPALVIQESRAGDAGLIFIEGDRGAWDKDVPIGVPTLALEAEQYGRIARLLENKVPVEVEAEVRARFLDDPAVGNTLAEIPGSDKKDEVVMAGAHLDSWHAGTGATDDGAGVAIVMEAVRLLNSLGVKPRRTIRVALWYGEEQGLLGSRHYVEEHFAARPYAEKPDEKDLPSYLRTRGDTIVYKPAYEKLSAYYNIDNGAGRLRGIYAQENSAVEPIFASWIAPFKDLGVSTLSLRSTGGTDHLSYDAVNLPGFQFIQDPLDYMSRTHHSNMDVFERAQREDLMQASVVLAAFLYQTAMRDEMMPRKPLLSQMQLVAEKPAAPAAAPPKASKVKKTNGKS